MMEVDLIWRIKVAAGSRGILVRQERDVIRCSHCNRMTSSYVMAGWPDLTLIGTKILYREIKTDTGRVSKSQEHIGAAIEWAESDWAVWREEDYSGGKIAHELDQIRMY